MVSSLVMIRIELKDCKAVFRLTEDKSSYHKKIEKIVLLVDVQKWKFFTIKHKKYCAYLKNVSGRFAYAGTNKKVVKEKENEKIFIYFMQHYTYI